jgi:formate dehydrogenase subunit delta
MSNSTEHLLEMANDIGAYFISDKNHERARDGVLNHLQKFWEPRMRQKLVSHWRASGGADLSPLVAEAVALLAVQADGANGTAPDAVGEHV